MWSSIHRGNKTIATGAKTSPIERPLRLNVPPQSRAGVTQRFDHFAEQADYALLDFRPGEIHDGIWRHQYRYIRIAQGFEQLVRRRLKIVRYDNGCRNAPLLEFDACVATPQRASASVGDTRHHQIALLGKLVHLERNLAQVFRMVKWPVRCAVQESATHIRFLLELLRQ